MFRHKSLQSSPENRSFVVKVYLIDFEISCFVLGEHRPTAGQGICGVSTCTVIVNLLMLFWRWKWGFLIGWQLVSSALGTAQQTPCRSTTDGLFCAASVCKMQIQMIIKLLCHNSILCYLVPAFSIPKRYYLKWKQWRIQLKCACMSLRYI